MKIQFNTDKTMNGDNRHEAYVTTRVSHELERFQSHITRIEVFLTDQNGIKEGRHDIKCTLEARLEGRKPIAVTNQSDSMELALSGALDKLKPSIQKIIEQMHHH